MAATLSKLEREYLNSFKELDPASVSQGKCEVCGKARTLIHGECTKCSMNAVAQWAEDWA